MYCQHYGIRLVICGLQASKQSYKLLLCCSCDAFDVTCLCVRGAADCVQAVLCMLRADLAGSVGEQQRGPSRCHAQHFGEVYRM